MIDVTNLPKAELHMHIEGSLEPEMMLRLARRNDVEIPFATPDEVAAACEFKDLQSFLNLFYAGLTVMRTARDFAEVTYAYMERAHADRVRRAELYLSPQAHLRRGVAVDTLMEGVREALEAARADFGISGAVIWGLQRQFPEAEAMETLDALKGHEDIVVALGMGGPERGNPPSKFRNVYAEARARGLRTTIHAGEEGDASYVREALELLQVDRIDHGVRAEEDDSLVAELVRRRMTLTVCPLSNVRLRVFDRIEDHNLARLLRRDVRVTVNSDDPSYFGGYVNANFHACQHALALSDAEILRLVRNSFTGAFLPQDEINVHLAELDRVIAEQQGGTHHHF